VHGFGERATAPQGHADLLARFTAALEIAFETNVIKAIGALGEGARRKLPTALSESQPAFRGCATVLAQLVADPEVATKEDIVKALSAPDDDARRKLLTALGDSQPAPHGLAAGFEADTNVDLGDSVGVFKLNAIFSELDANCVGYLRKDEFAAALKVDGRCHETKGWFHACARRACVLKASGGCMKV